MLSLYFSTFYRKKSGYFESIVYICANQIIQKMRVAILVDNRSRGAQYACEHGLSVYVEVADERYLFDTGQSDKFILNAQELGIELEKLDLAVISHGHYDHGGGLQQLLGIAPELRIACSPQADCRCFSVSTAMTKYSGLPEPEIVRQPNRIPVNGIVKISNHLTLFTLPHSAPSNPHLMRETTDGLVPDTFADEVFALLREDDKNVIFGGCTHHGLAQLFDFYTDIFKNKPITAFIGGLHLSGKSAEEIEAAAATAEKMHVGTWIINHCSGEEAIGVWQKRFGANPLSGFAGSITEI